MNNKNLLVGLLVVLVVAIGGYMFPKAGQSVLGAIGTRFQHGVSINTNTSPASNGFRIGDNGSEFTEMKLTQCNVLGAGTNGLVINATSTKAFSCAVTGVASGDLVLAQFATSTQGLITRSFEIVGASASSTAGFVVLSILNSTGADNTRPAEMASSTTIFYGDI